MWLMKSPRPLVLTWRWRKFSMKRQRLSLSVFLPLILLTCGAWTGSWTSHNFLYQPNLGAKRATGKSTFDTGLHRVDARLEKEIWVGDPNYGTTVQSAVSAIGSSNVTLHIPLGTWSIVADLIVPPNVALRFERGAMLSVADTKTLTVNGPVEAGLHQIFSWAGTGRIVFDSRYVKEVYPQWWGAAGDGVTDDTTALQAALTACKVVRLTKGIFKYTIGLIVQEGGTIFGDGPDSILYRSTDAGGSPAGLYPYNYVTLQNFTLRGSGSSFVAGASGVQVFYKSGGSWSPLHGY